MPTPACSARTRAFRLPAARRVTGRPHPHPRPPRALNPDMPALPRMTPVVIRRPSSAPLVVPWAGGHGGLPMHRERSSVPPPVRPCPGPPGSTPSSAPLFHRVCYRHPMPSPTSPGGWPDRFPPPTVVFSVWVVLPRFAVIAPAEPRSFGCKPAPPARAILGWGGSETVCGPDRHRPTRKVPPPCASWCCSSRPSPSCSPRPPWRKTPRSPGRPVGPRRSTTTKPRSICGST